MVAPVLQRAVERLEHFISRLRTAKLYQLVLAVAAFSAVVFLAGLAAGNWAADQNIKTRLVGLFSESPASADSQTVEWSQLQANLHTLDIANLQLQPFETNGKGGAIVEIDGDIVFASPLGQLGYLTPDYEMRLLDLRVPVNIEDLQQTEYYTHPLFIPALFRVLDLAVLEKAPGSYDLFASHHRFADDCFEVVVSRASLVKDDGGLRPDTGDWEDVFVAEPCIPPKQHASLFSGNEAGGRMVLNGDGELLLSLGDAQFNGVDDERVFAQDPDADLGKLIAIDLATGQSRHVAAGLRNPQGLLVASDGTIWETEHGPQGGDEINVMRDGANYGWPLVTYGVHYSYGGARRDWTMSEAQARHDGYELPIFAFVPSIGISNLTEPDLGEFPLWRDHLIVGSLAGQTLYLVRLEGGRRAAYAEQILIGHSVRDMVTLDDGRIAILTDEGRLLLIRNAELAPQRHEEGAQIASVQYSSEVAALHEASARVELDVGQELFWTRCSTCHSMGGALGVGPPLNGVLGREVGGVEGYGYSPVLSSHGGTWSPALLKSFLSGGSPEFQGVTMPPARLSAGELNEIVGFLQR